MPVILPCVKCKRKLRVLDRLLGKLVKCPGCQTKFVARAPGTPVVTAASAPSAASHGRASAPKPPASSKAPASRTVPKPPSSKVPGSRPAVLPVSGASRARAAKAMPPPEEIPVEHGEEDFMPAALLPRQGPQLDEVEMTAPGARKPGARQQRQSSLIGVFVTLGGILLLTTILGLLTAWWVNSSMQYLQGSRTMNPPRQPGK